jgi:ABC-type lipoprotein release transport system permease subunit
VSDGLVVVRGVFDTRGAAAFLTGVLFIPHAEGVSLLGLAPGETLELIARSTTNAKATAMLSGYRVTPWWRAAPLIDAVLTVWQGAGALTQSVLAAVGFLLVLNAMLAKLHDRTRELGTLRALGLSATGVTIVVALEYLLLAIAATTLAAVVVTALVALAGPNGVPLAGEALQAAYMGRRLHPVLLGGDVLWVVSLGAIIALGATVPPITRVVWRQPATLLRTRT